MHVDSFDNITTKNDFDLVEIKTTLKVKVFFGFTKNEEIFLLDNYKLCIVHTKLKDYVNTMNMNYSK